ncbi:MAG: hypothetical protein ACP5M0_08075 [Desulfomonilaceae bacterium]
MNVIVRIVMVRRVVMIMLMRVFAETVMGMGMLVLVRMFVGMLVFVRMAVHRAVGRQRLGNFLAQLCQRLGKKIICLKYQCNRLLNFLRGNGHSVFGQTSGDLLVSLEMLDIMVQPMG